MLTPKDILLMKSRGEKIAMTTAYDFAFASMAEQANIDMILVGDSLANTMLGYNSTSEIGMNEMEIFTKAVYRGAKNTHIVADMPYKSDVSPNEAVENAKRLLSCGAHSVKLEGAKSDIIKALLDNDIQVMGHLGLLPQTAENFKQCGNSKEDAEKIFEEAKMLESLGVYSMVLEHVPDALGKQIAKSVKPVVIGIGAGQDTDGQVLVMHDFLGLHTKKLPPFAKKFANLFDAGVLGFSEYRKFVKGKNQE